MQADLSLLYVLMAVVIFLALLAALGAWTRSSGLKRDDAESLFSDAQEKHREEIARLEKIIDEQRAAALDAHSKTESSLAGRLHELDAHLTRSRTDLESAVARASSDQSEALSDELELVSRRITESERRMAGNLENLQNQVSQAGDQMKQALLEITRQQQEQKAQSTVQLCEALITSLGTLKTSITQQIAGDSDSHRTVEAGKPGVAEIGQTSDVSLDDIRSPVINDDDDSDSDDRGPAPFAAAADFAAANTTGARAYDSADSPTSGETMDATMSEVDDAGENAEQIDTGKVDTEHDSDDDSDRAGVDVDVDHDESERVKPDHKKRDHESAGQADYNIATQEETWSPDKA